VKLTRSPQVVKKALVKQEDGRVLTRVPCTIQVPVHWMSVNLGEIATETRIYGFFPIILETGEYSVMSVCSMITIVPSRTTIVTVGEVAYYEFSFDANTTIFKTLTLVRQDTIVYHVLNELWLKGKVPWWATVDDLCKVFSTAKKHADSNIAKVPETVEFLTAIISRSKSNRAEYLRQSASSPADWSLENIDYIPLSSVIYAVSNVVNKLTGNYFHEGVVSSLTTPSDQVNKVEQILRA